MSTYLGEIADADHGGNDRQKQYTDTQRAMAAQVIEVARMLQAADSEDEQEPLGAYMEAAAVVVQTQALGLALRKLQYAIADGGAETRRRMS
jgi:hypothetical protein